MDAFWTDEGRRISSTERWTEPVETRRRRFRNRQHPNAYKMYVCSPPVRMIAPQHQKCFKAK